MTTTEPTTDVTGPITAATVTGAWVLAFRTRHKLSRDRLMREGGWEGKSGARIMNIETHDGWKNGDRERFIAVVQRLEPSSVDTGSPVDTALAGMPGGLQGPAVDAFWALVGELDDDDADADALPLWSNDDDADADDACGSDCESPTDVPTDDAQPDEVPPIARLTDPNAQPIPVQSGAQMPRGWEHLYPVDDPRHVHRFDEHATSCANATCPATPTGQPVPEPTPDPVAQLLAASTNLGAQPVAAGFGRPVAVVPDDGIKTLTQSELALWKRCRRAWMLAIWRQLRPRERSATDARATGDRVHRALAAMYHPDPAQRVDARDALERVIVEDWTRIKQQAEQAGMDETWIETKAAEFADVNALERIMVEGYVEHLAETGADAGYQVIAAEEALSVVVDLPGTNRQLRLLGKLDAQLRRESDGAVLVEDHKTTNSIAQALPTLKMNPQMMFYLVLKWLVSGDADRIDGALYNMLRKVKRTVRAQPPFYDRAEVHYNHAQLENFLKQTLASAREIVAATDALDAGYEHHVVTPPTQTPECRWCDFFGVCTMLDDGSRVEDALAANFEIGNPLARYAEELVVQRPDGTVVA